jgi:hypothetical protein
MAKVQRPRYAKLSRKKERAIVTQEATNRIASSNGNGDVRAVLDRAIAKRESLDAAIAKLRGAVSELESL